MSRIINQINALRVLRALFEILPNHPANIGKSYVIGSIISKELSNRKEIFTKSFDHKLRWSETQKDFILRYFGGLFSNVAEHIPLNSLFFSEDAPQVIANAVADIVRNTDRANQDDFIPVDLTGDPKFPMLPQLQRYLSQVRLWGAGRCYNYASLSLYHLLDAGVRPVDALWLNDPVNSTGNGHQIIAIGLSSDDEYTKIAESDALILDFWSGEIISASEYFNEKSKFHNWGSSVIQLCRINEGENNPFTTPPLIESLKIEKFKKETSDAMVQIINERKKKGEVIPEFDLNEKLIEQARIAVSDVNDIEFKNRTSAIKKNAWQLKGYERFASKIQKNFRDYLSKNSIELSKTTSSKSKMMPKQEAMQSNNSVELTANIELALKAKEYSRSLIKWSSSTLHEPIARSKIIEMRNWVFDLDVSLKTLLRVSYNDLNASVYHIKDNVARVKRFSLGNCGEYSFLALNYLRKQNVHRAEQFIIEGDDHAFVVIGRVIDSLQNDPKTWGANAVICDPWADRVYPASDIMKNILCFKYEDGENKTYAFDPEINIFKSYISIGSNSGMKISMESFKSEASRKINVIFRALLNSVNDHSEINSFIEEFTRLTREINEGEYEKFDQFSKIHPERMFSKIVLGFLKTALNLIKTDNERNKFGSMIVNLLFEVEEGLDVYPKFFLLRKSFEIIRQCHDTVALAFIENMPEQDLFRLVHERRNKIGSIMVCLFLEKQDVKFAAIVRKLSLESLSKVEQESNFRQDETPIKMLHAVTLNGLKQSFNELVNKYSQELLRPIVSTVINGRTLPEIALSGLGIDSFLHLLNKLSQQEEETEESRTLTRIDDQCDFNLFNEKINTLQENKQCFIKALLFYAAANGFTLIFKNLVNNYEVNIDELSNSLNATLIFMAAQNGHIDIVKLLLEKKCSQLIPFTSSDESLRNFAKSRGNDVILRMNEFIELKLRNGAEKAKIQMLPKDIAYVMNNNEVLISLEINLIREKIQSSIKETLDNDSWNFNYSDIDNVALRYNQEAINAIKKELQSEGFIVNDLTDFMQVTAPRASLVSRLKMNDQAREGAGQITFFKVKGDLLVEKEDDPKIGNSKKNI